MLKPLFIFLFVAMVFAGCKSTPKGILSEDKMVAVYTDLHIAEGRLKTVGIFADSAKKMAPVLYDQVYKTHMVTREEFIKSYQYYQSQPKQFERIIDRMIVELTKKEAGIPGSATAAPPQKVEKAATEPISK